VVWDDWRPPLFTYSGNVYAQHIGVDGIVDPDWSTDGNRVCTNSGGQGYPFVTSDGSGGYVIAWADYRDGVPTADDDLYAARLTSHGTLATGWPVDGLPICTAPGAQISQAIVSDGNGGAWIAWTDDRGGGYTYDLYAQHLGADGTTAPGGLQNGFAVCMAPGMQVQPKITADGTGGAFLVWYDFRSGTDTDIFAQRLSVNGNSAESIASPIKIRMARPNPTKSATEFIVEIADDGQVSARVYDISGRLIRQLLNSAPLIRGSHRIPWDGRDRQGRDVPSGAYYVKVDAGAAATSHRIVITR
jgi:hypothetical protein